MTGRFAERPENSVAVFTRESRSHVSVWEKAA
jgi:hypothetical protein